MGRSPCGESGDVKKGPWTQEEDQILIDFVQKHGYGSWRALPKRAGLNRCGKSCRLRWINYLRPDIKRGQFSQEEEQLIINLHSSLGNKWSKIATQLPGRTDNEIKNFWNTQLRKKLLGIGIDPKTHKPIPNVNFLINNISELMNSNSRSKFQMINPLLINNALRVSPDITSINNNLLQNILQIVNMSPLSNVLELLGSQFNFNQSDSSSASEMINEYAMSLYQEPMRFLNASSMDATSNMIDLKSSSESFVNENQLPGLESTSNGETMDIKNISESNWDNEDYSFLWKDLAVEEVFPSIELL